MTDEDDQYFYKYQYKKIIWSEDEVLFQKSRDHKKRIFTEYSLPLTKAVIRQLSKSCFRIFLDVLNPQQDQDSGLLQNKLDTYEYDLKLLTKNKLQALTDNRLFEMMLPTLRTMIKNGLPVTLDILRKTIASLTILNYYTNIVDIGLKKFETLQYLVLAGNNIRDINGSNLPRNLKFLELNDNFISSLENFLNDPPKQLLHIGLGRNCLNDSSSLHLLKENGILSHLHSLDLSNNDICDLIGILNNLNSCKCLKSLQLQGNPCYVDVFYLNQCATNLPNLVYLDNTQILPEDRTKLPCLPVDTKPQLIFQCYRIMSLPKPPKEKKNIQTIHVEVSFPLLENKRKILQDEEEIIKETEISDNPTSENIPYKPTEDVIKAESTRIKLDKDKSKSEIKGKKKSKNDSKKIKTNIKEKSSKDVKQEKQNPYSKNNEYDEKAEKYNFSVKSPRLTWNKMLTFPEMSINIPDNNLLLLRDTLKSKIKVKVVYLVVAPPLKPKKEKEGKKEKFKKKSVKDNSEIIKKADQELTDNSKDILAAPEETILTKTTLFSFNCNMEPINWSHKSNDYFWADHKKMGSTAMKIEGSLQNCIFQKPPKGANKSLLEKENTVQKIPKIATVHLAFGLRRDLFNELSPARSTSNLNIAMGKKSNIKVVKD